jgi:hypothetical protein
MLDMQAQLEKLRAEAADCRLMSDLAADKEKRQLFSQRAEHLSALAAELARRIDEASAAGDQS